MIRKTLLKTFSYGCMHMVIAVAVAFILSGSWKIALAIGLIEPCVQTIAFFFHERAWHKFGGDKPGQDYHNVVIDSTTPATEVVEDILRHKH